ncbi:MAG: gamma-glutamyltransferase [gamma proteobacterium endosymbiont of Lamellibrachia anaximandri]|nr:gamma-glutamyltransferase [gamma proteobacterium endosymbiont of Lamellibrachia anaximandri]MBL3534505.1 gamma-glutamyltransferase [gamma proteobacterium endosymbiont of Lamellibrachia anaximandri]
MKAPFWSLFFCFILSLSGVAAAGGKPSAAAIASAHPLATEAGHRILDAGGNAFDAAVAVSAVLAVVEPYSSGIGGGGFWLLHRASDGFEVMVDGRERAPLAAHRDLYLDESGKVKPGLSINGPLAAGIPGEPAALVHIAEKYGRLPLKTSLAPAVRLARDGFPVDDYYLRMAGWRLKALRQGGDAKGIFLNAGELPAADALLRQPDLSRTLTVLAEKGREGFYQGEVASRLVEGVRQAGGIWTLKDLQEYRIVEREPVRGEYRGWKITSAALPSSGGIVLVSMLNMLQGLGLESADEATRIHLIIEAMRRAYRDRADYMGDTDFVDVPVGALIHPWYAAGLARDIQRDRATPSVGNIGGSGEGRDTTHFSILDREGNRVSATLSINYPFGSGFIPPGTGVLLNDEMDDFSAQPGVPNIYGLVGGEANAIAPGKRMLSSMSPTFVAGDEGVAILGTPGGSRIITMLLLGVLELADGKGPQAWVDRPRFHHQYLPDQVQFEPGALENGVRTKLSEMGHSLKPLDSSYGNMQAVYWNRRSGEVSAASDHRGIGEAQVR